VPVNALAQDHQRDASGRITGLADRREAATSSDRENSGLE